MCRAADFRKTFAHRWNDCAHEPTPGHRMTRARALQHALQVFRMRPTTAHLMCRVAPITSCRMTVEFAQRMARQPTQPYGPDSDVADRQEFAAAGRKDRHQFRFIVAPEDGVELVDLRDFTRELMATMERDLGTRLEWIAVDRWDTDNPHTDVVLRGKDDRGKDLIIARSYLTDGMCLRAGELSS